MTGKELIEMLKIIKEQAIKSNNDTAIIDVKIDSFNFVIGETIKALEQDIVPFGFELYQAGLMEMPKEMIEVLDKIRAEIEEQVLESLSDGGDDWFTAEKVNECLEIIDKYRAEIK